MNTTLTFNMDQREVFTNILTRIANGIMANRSVGHPKNPLINSFIVDCIKIKQRK